MGNLQQSNLSWPEFSASQTLWRPDYPANSMTRYGSAKFGFGVYLPPWKGTRLCAYSFPAIARSGQWVSLHRNRSILVSSRCYGRIGRVIDQVNNRDCIPTNVKSSPWFEMFTSTIPNILEISTIRRPPGTQSYSHANICGHFLIGGHSDLVKVTST